MWKFKEESVNTVMIIILTIFVVVIIVTDLLTSL